MVAFVPLPLYISTKHQPLIIASKLLYQVFIKANDPLSQGNANPSIIQLLPDHIELMDITHALCVSVRQKGSQLSQDKPKYDDPPQHGEESDPLLCGQLRSDISIAVYYR